jgi:hypothetical protein
MLKARYAPGWPREKLLMAGPDQQQLRQHHYAKGFLNTSFLCTDLVRAQAKVRLQFPGDLLYGPPALIGTHDLSRGPLVQIGHRILVCFGPL